MLLALVRAVRATSSVSAPQHHRRRGPLILLQQANGSGSGGARIRRQRCHLGTTRTLSSIRSVPLRESSLQQSRTQPLHHHQQLQLQQHRSYSASNIVLLPPHTLFPMPALSPTMETGSIASWNIGEGTSFSAGDVLCTIDTDKASVDFEAQDDGVLAKILIQANSGDIAIGMPICVVVEDQGDVAAFSEYTAPKTETAAAAVAGAAAAEPAAPAAAPTASPTTTSSSGDGPFILMPSARHLSESKGFNATGLQGSGKGGRVTKADVAQALLEGTMPPLNKKAATQTVVAAAPAPPPLTTPAPLPLPLSLGDLVVPVPEIIDTFGTMSFEDLPNNKMRKIIASRLTESKRDVPHFYTTAQVNLDDVLALRKRLAKEHSVKVSVNDFVLKCCGLALRDVPQVNATYQAATNSIAQQSNIDVSVAVATPTGLITPIVFGCDKLGLSQITGTVLDLASRARLGKLAPHEYQGGTFSVSNLGMFGLNQFSAVINPPQAAILAVGGGVRTIVATPYNEDGQERANKKPSIQTLMTVQLSADRRVVDEATAALFLSAFTHYMKDPELMLL